MHGDTPSSCISSHTEVTVTNNMHTSFRSGNSRSAGRGYSLKLVLSQEQIPHKPEPTIGAYLCGETKCNSPQKGAVNSASRLFLAVAPVLLEQGQHQLLHRYPERKAAPHRTAGPRPTALSIAAHSTDAAHCALHVVRALPAWAA